MRVLIADDEPEMRRWLLRALEFLGHEADAVGDGEELLRRAGNFQPDVVISDIGLPGRNGISTGLRLREERPNGRVVLMTGDKTLAEKAREAGFSEVLDKPFSLDELLAVL